VRESFFTTTGVIGVFLLLGIRTHTLSLSLLFFDLILLTAPPGHVYWPCIDRQKHQLASTKEDAPAIATSLVRSPSPHFQLLTTRLVVHDFSYDTTYYVRRVEENNKKKTWIVSVYIYTYNNPTTDC